MIIVDGLMRIRFFFFLEILFKVTNHILLQTVRNRLASLDSWASYKKWIRLKEHQVNQMIILKAKKNTFVLSNEIFNFLNSWSTGSVHSICFTKRWFYNFLFLQIGSEFIGSSSASSFNSVNGNIYFCPIS